MSRPPWRWRPLGLVVVVLVGMGLGAAATLAVQDRRADGAADERGVEAADSTTVVDPRAPDRAGVVPVGAPSADPPAGPPTQQVLLAWTIDPLPAGVADAVAAIPDVERVTAVRHGLVGLVDTMVDGVPMPDPAAGWQIPLDVIAVDPAGYPAFVPPDLAATFATLSPTDAVLSRTGAQLRGVGVGAPLEVVPPARSTPAPTAAPGPAPVTLTVTAIVDDAAVGGAELAVSAGGGALLGIDADRYLLVAHHTERAAVEDSVRALLPGPVRFRGPGETPFLRDADAVLPPATIKAAFGEFAIRRSGAGFTQDAAWQQATLVDTDVPVLGRVRCHRAVVDDLRAAMAQIERDNLAYLIDPTPSSVACWYLDTIDRSGSISRGAWGVAVVLNSLKNPSGSGSVQDPRVVGIMQAHGFTWGGSFLVPEPAYFEHVGPTAAPPAG